MSEGKGGLFCRAEAGAGGSPDPPRALPGCPPSLAPPVRVPLRPHLGRALPFQDMFAAAVSLVTGKILYVSDQVAPLFRCKSDAFQDAKFVEFLAPHDVGMFHSSTTPCRLPPWSVCRGAGEGLGAPRGGEGPRPPQLCRRPAQRPPSPSTANEKNLLRTS